MDIRSDRQKGMSYAEISRKYHIDPRTAKKYAESDTRPVYSLTEPKPSKLDPYKEFVHNSHGGKIEDFYEGVVGTKALFVSGDLSELTVEIPNFFESCHTCHFRSSVIYTIAFHLTFTALVKRDLTQSNPAEYAGTVQNSHFRAFPWINSPEPFHSDLSHLNLGLYI